MPWPLSATNGERLEPEGTTIAIEAGTRFIASLHACLAVAARDVLDDRDNSIDSTCSTTSRVQTAQILGRAAVNETQRGREPGRRAGSDDRRRRAADVLVRGGSGQAIAAAA
jgi:hypothetical protein